MKQNENLSKVERRQKIQQMVEAQGRVLVEDICASFDISKATARRDLDDLAEQQQIIRFHGGALRKNSAIAESDIPVHQRNSEQTDAKSRIGARAAELIQDGETIFLASGSTVLEVAKHLHGKKVNVLTNSLLVMNELWADESIEVISTGGILRRSELSFIGHISEKSLEEICADKVFLGTFSIHPSTGLTHNYLPEIMTDRAIINIGRQVIVVADHTKFNRSASAFLVALSKVNVLVTDAAAPPKVVDQIEKSGVQVILA